MITWNVLLAVVITAMALWAYFTAQRLNKLHIRTDAALASLQSALDRRAAVMAALNPTTLPLAQSAEAISLEHGKFESRASKEREITSALEDLNPDFLAQIMDSEVRVQLAHRFYNDAVADTRALRLRPAIRVFRLGGTAPLPEYFEYHSY